MWRHHSRQCERAVWEHCLWSSVSGQNCSRVPQLCRWQLWDSKPRPLDCRDSSLSTRPPAVQIILIIIMIVFIILQVNYGRKSDPWKRLWWVCGEISIPSSPSSSSSSSPSSSSYYRWTMVENRPWTWICAEVIIPLSRLVLHTARGARGTVVCSVMEWEKLWSTLQNVK